MNSREKNAGSAPPLPVRSAGPTPPRETGWLPDCVYTGEKFEAGLAFFADAVGRITRFSREPADLAMARRLAGQAALPGLVNAHSHAFHRVLRGRGEARPRAAADAAGTWREAAERIAGRLSGDDVYDAVRLAFVEMLLSGITCVGEFHYLHHQPDGAPWPDANFLSHEILRAAHDIGIRVALLKVACAPAGIVRSLTPGADQFIREAEALRTYIGKNHPADDAWSGVAVPAWNAVPPDYFKALASYVHTQRLRLHVQVSETTAENDACVAEHGRTPVALLAERGLIDKRFTAVGAIHLTDDDARILGAARAAVCACPTSARSLGLGAVPGEKLLAAGAAVALGSDTQVQIDLLEEARLLEPALRVGSAPRSALAPEVATALFNAATVAGARSLGATGGALEVGRPADFFTVSLFDPSLAGAEPGGLLGNILFSPGRPAIRDVWVGARELVVNGRHAHQGVIVSKFVELQRRLWAAG